MNLLVADIGGTNARFAFQADNTQKLSNFAYLKCSDFSNIHDAIKYYKNNNNLNINNMSVAVASTTKQDTIKFTNNHWNFKQSEIFKYFKLNKLIFINDFVAQSLSFSSFYLNISEDQSLNHKLAMRHNLKIIRKGIPIKNAPLLVIGPGTGLGICTLFQINNNPISIEGEGGHSSFAPNSEIEIELLQFMKKKYNHVSNERLVSGSGIEEIYNFICLKNCLKNHSLKAPEIGKKALSGEFEAKETIKLLFSMLGTIVSNVILINGTQSGVILSGGITPRLKEILNTSNFEINLLNKGRRHDYIKNVPIWLTEDNKNGLYGALNAINNPHYADKLIVKD